MATYQFEVLGSQATNGKDFINTFSGFTIDLYQENLIPLVDYVITVLGASSQGGTMPNPAVIVFNSFGEVVAYQLDGPIKLPNFDEQLRDPFWNFRGGTFSNSPDPLLNFKPSNFSNPSPDGVYWVGVIDQSNAVGTSYTLSVEGAGVPVFFGSGVAGVASGGLTEENVDTPVQTVSNIGALPTINAEVVSSSIANDSAKDLLIGTEVNEKLVGGNTDDRLFGNGGNDTLVGGRGRDILVGGSGNNVLTGGKGNDIFVLEKGDGRSIVKDFQDQKDKLGLTYGLGFKDLSLKQRGDNTLISVDKDKLMLLIGVQSSQIKASDFTSV
jgi:Ca2+-binding RTX toxin-like protein